jgi:hypothetical protein
LRSANYAVKAAQAFFKGYPSHLRLLVQEPQGFQDLAKNKNDEALEITRYYMMFEHSCPATDGGETCE